MSKTVKERPHDFREYNIQSPLKNDFIQRHRLYESTATEKKMNDSLGLKYELHEEILSLEKKLFYDLENELSDFNYEDIKETMETFFFKEAGGIIYLGIRVYVKK